MIDWRHVAVQVAYGDGAFYLLTTEERDALEIAASEINPAGRLSPVHEEPAERLRTSGEALKAHRCGIHLDATRTDA